MPGDRFIIPFPSDTIRLNGVLQGTLSTIRCATSNLTYKEYMSISSTFLLVSEKTISEALKSLSIHQEIGFDSYAAMSYAEKNIDSISDDMVFTAILIASIEKTISLYSEFCFSNEAKISAEKAFEQLRNEIGFEDSAYFSAEKSDLFASSVGLDSIVISAYAEKQLEHVTTLLAIENALTLCAEKHFGAISSKADFSSCVSSSLAQYRKFFHLDGLTFADIANWNMETFYIISN